MSVDPVNWPRMDGPPDRSCNRLAVGGSPACRAHTFVRASSYVKSWDAGRAIDVSAFEARRALILGCFMYSGRSHDCHKRLHRKDGNG